jgi:hypothetical protein
MTTISNILDFYAEQSEDVWQEAAAELTEVIGGPAITLETLEAWHSGEVMPLNVLPKTVISAFVKVMEQDYDQVI